MEYMWDIQYYISYAIVSGGFHYRLGINHWHVCLADCTTNYHHNYSINAEFRTYYGGVPNLIQVGEHQFIEKWVRVVDLFMGMMLVAWYVYTQLTRRE